MTHIFSAKAAVALYALALALVALPCSAPAAGPQVGHFTLANGLEVVVVPDHRTPVVTHMIWYKVGSADETAGKSGLAHFLEHLMFKGTAENPEGRFSQTVATLGGQENAFTTSDYTGYFQRIAREHLEEMMTFEADRMTGLVLTDDNVRPELNVVLEEWNMRVANSPDARLGEQMTAALYLNHPYGRPVIGWHHEIEKLDREEALAFYRRFYTPNNAVVVISGDVTPDEVKRLAEKTYAKVPRVAEVAPRLRPQEPTPAAPRQVTLADARVAQPSMQRSYLVPSYSTSARDADTPKAGACAMARACFPAAISDFEGTQPKLRQSPPMRPFSTSTTGTPNAAAAAATDRPPEPAPMTQMSGFSSSGMPSPRAFIGSDVSIRKRPTPARAPVSVSPGSGSGRRRRARPAPPAVRASARPPDRARPRNRCVRSRHTPCRPPPGR